MLDRGGNTARTCLSMRSEESREGSGSPSQSRGKGSKESSKGSSKGSEGSSKESKDGRKGSGEDGKGGAWWGNNSGGCGAGNSDSSDHHHHRHHYHRFSTIPRIPGRGNTLGTNRRSVVESNELIKFRIFLSCRGVIDALSLVCRDFILGLATVTVSHQRYKNYRSSKTSRIVIER